MVRLSRWTACPAGIALSEKSFAADLARRKSGKRGTTPRKESDAPHIVTGVFNGRTTGAPLTVVYYNENTLSGDYRNLVTHPRPSHADWVAMTKYKGFARLPRRRAFFGTADPRTGYGRGSSQTDPQETLQE